LLALNADPIFRLEHLKLYSLDTRDN
jgi:hypothetical protein